MADGDALGLEEAEEGAAVHEGARQQEMDPGPMGGGARAGGGKVDG